MQGLLASYGDKAHTGQVYATAALVDMLARMAGAIVYSNLFSWGWNLSPRWGRGLPFFVGSVSIPVLPALPFKVITDKNVAAQFLDVIGGFFVADAGADGDVNQSTRFSEAGYRTILENHWNSCYVTKRRGQIRRKLDTSIPPN